MKTKKIMSLLLCGVLTVLSLIGTPASFFSVSAAKIDEADVLAEENTKPATNRTRAADIIIDATNFPDANFRGYVSKEIDKNSNGKLDTAERAAVRDIEVSKKNITNMKGIEFFDNLVNLTCTDNKLASLDVSNNSKLEMIDCVRNKITSLDLSNNPNLRWVEVVFNELTSLKIGSNSILLVLLCGDNKLTNLDLSKVPNLTVLVAENNQITSLDLRNNLELSNLWCSENSLTSLDLRKNGKLELLDISKNQLNSILMGANLSPLKYFIGDDNKLKMIPNLKTAKALDIGGRVVLTQFIGERHYRTSFKGNELPGSELRNKLPSHFLQETTWLVEQMNNQRGAVPQYIIDFDANGGSITTKNKTVTNGTTYGTLPTGTRINYTFKGWYTEKTGGTKVEAGTRVSLTNNQTLYAQWDIKTYKIEFNANKGRGTMKEVTLTHGIAKKLTANTFKRTGYTFTGWNTKANGKGKAYKNKVSVKNQDLTLYAQWKKNTYTVKFKGNKSTSGKMSNQKMSYGTSKKLRANKFKRTGYKFVGWNTKANGKGKAYKNKASVKNKNLTLYAQWRKNK